MSEKKYSNYSSYGVTKLSVDKDKPVEHSDTVSRVEIKEVANKFVTKRNPVSIEKEYDDIFSELIKSLKKDGIGEILVFDKYKKIRKFHYDIPKNTLKELPMN